jgi:hypothetical protein
MSHTMKLWERIIKHRLRGVTNVTENQFDFMPWRSTMEAIFLIRQLMERCKLIWFYAREIDYGDDFLDKTAYGKKQGAKEGSTYGLH